MQVWDDLFLKIYQAEARDEARRVVTEADWQLATAQVQRVLSDDVRGYVLCPASRCRRARRCVHDAVICAEHVDFGIGEAELLQRIEAVYAQMQMARRDAGKG